MTRPTAARSQPQSTARRGGGLAALLALLVAAPLAASQPAIDEPPEAAATDPLAAWLEEVAPILTEREREVYEGLERGYQRRHFIERFWAARDPFPDTPANEFRDVWEQRVAMARRRFGDLEGERARALLLVGPPDRQLPALCSRRLRKLEVWLYGSSGRARRGFALIFLPRGGDYRLWSPTEGLSSLVDPISGRGSPGRTSLGELQADCFGEDVVAILQGAVDWPLLERQLALVPRPSGEWVEAFARRQTDLPESAERFAAEVKFHFPGRHQSRTTVQALVTVPRPEVTAAVVGERTTYNFSVEGEVLRGEELFDRFRYRFDLPAPDAGSDYLPLVLQRHLRPGGYTIVMRIEDRNSGRYYRAETALEVPQVESYKPLAVAVEDDPLAARPLVSAATARLEQILAEARAEAGDGDAVVRLLPPPPGLHTGRLRVEAAAIGDQIRKVRFHLNGKPVLAKTRPPFSVELDLGEAPRRHWLEAMAVDEAGLVVARDKISLNTGPHAFDVRLLEPQPGGRYHQSLTALVEVDKPSDRRLDRVEIFLNEHLVATLYQEPFVQPIVLPSDEEISYVKTVAHLADGHSDQDIVFVNTPSQLEQLEIQMVELYTSVVDRRGRPVEDLGAESFTVLENGDRQAIRRIDRVTDLPINAGIVLDTSTSMTEEIDEAEQAAQAFFERVLRPQDRAAVLVFNDTWELKVPLTNRIDELKHGLSGLEADGETALYDTLVQALYYFSGLSGKRALVLLTDGEDSRSRYNYAQTLEFARRSGVAIYAIGLDLSPRDFEVVSKLRRLASETGGACYTITRASELDSIYEKIEQELRTQYVLAYQSSQSRGDDYRTVEVRLDRPGLKAKTIPGYYP